MSQALIIKGADFSENAFDTITFQGKHATSISLSETALSFDAIGDTATLTTTALPYDHEDTIRWVSSNSNVATVSNGVVTVVGVGTCTITATTGRISATCAVGVEVELTGYQRFVKTSMFASSASNKINYSETVLGTSATSNKRMIMFDTESVYSGKPILNALLMAKYNSNTGRNEVQTDPSTMATGSARFYNNIGYPLPIVLPPNCTKIKCIGLSGDYMPFAYFYKKDVFAYDKITTNSAEGKASLQAYRELSDFTEDYIENVDNYSKEQINEYDIPSGCDSIHVTWNTDVDASGVVLFPDMTSEQLASFKIIAM